MFRSVSIGVKINDKDLLAEERKLQGYMGLRAMEESRFLVDMDQEYVEFERISGPVERFVSYKGAADQRFISIDEIEDITPSMEDQYCSKWETDSFQFVVTYLFEKAERVTTLKDLYQTINLANRYDLGVFEDRLLDELEKAEARIRAMMAIEEKEKKETKVAILLIRRISAGQIVNPKRIPHSPRKRPSVVCIPNHDGKERRCEGAGNVSTQA